MVYLRWLRVNLNFGYCAEQVTSDDREAFEQTWLAVWASAYLPKRQASFRDCERLVQSL